MAKRNQGSGGRFAQFCPRGGPRRNGARFCSLPVAAGRPIRAQIALGRHDRGNPHRRARSGSSPRRCAPISWSQPGDTFDADRIDQSLKALFATGLFADVTLRREGNALVVHVVENPVINRIAFEGNQQAHRRERSTTRSSSGRASSTPATKVQSDVKRILDLYRRNGRFAATVDPKIIQLDAEPRRSGVRDQRRPDHRRRAASISSATSAFSASRLREVIQTKESRWYRFLSIGRHLRSRPAHL